MINAIKGKDNTADLGTKSLSRDKIRKYMTTIGYIGDYLDQEVVEGPADVRFTSKPHRDPSAENKPRRPPWTRPPPLPTPPLAEAAATDESDAEGQHGKKWFVTCVMVRMLVAICC